MTRWHYRKILGVEADAPPEAIKKAYREKAKRLHPDLNPNFGAEDEFVRLREAYEALYFGKFPRRSLILRPQSKPKYTAEEVAFNKRDRYQHPKTAADREAHLRKARELLRKRKERAQRIFAVRYRRYLRSWPYRVTLGLSALSVIFGILVLVEQFLPGDTDYWGVEHKVAPDYSQASFAGARGMDFELQFCSNRMHVGIDIFNATKVGEPVRVTTSPIFHEITEVAVMKDDKWVIHQEKGNLNKLYFLFFIALSLPILTFLLRAPNTFYFKLVHFNRLIAVIFISWLLLGNDRLFSLLSGPVC